MRTLAEIPDAVAVLPCNRRLRSTSGGAADAASTTVDLLVRPTLGRTITLGQ